MGKSDEDILAEFYNWCGDICAGKSPTDIYKFEIGSEEFKAAKKEKEEYEKRTNAICKAMIDSGQQGIMTEEFKKIGKTLAKG